ncbi:iron ABC transporter permease [Paenibacillus sp. P25]|nr:iron ABC transporter permease [Paenibacillus sp. P25]
MNHSRYTTLRGKGFSFLVQKKAVSVTLLLLAVTAALMIISTGIGSIYISPAEVLRSIFGFGADSSEMIVRSLRSPRIVMAVLIGASLAVSGAILQGVVRNALASPTRSGRPEARRSGPSRSFSSSRISSASTCAARGCGRGVRGYAARLHFILEERRYTARLVLVGIGFSAAMSSLSYMMMISGPIILANQSLTFMTGSIYGVSWEKSVLPLLPWMIVLPPLAFILARHLNIQELGEDIASGVGDAVQRQRFLLLLLSVALAGAGVAFGGAINFIGLLAPHIARRLVGPSFGALLPVSALTGAIVLLLADLAGRSLFPPHDIPAGVFTAAIGAPFFIYLLYRTRNR